jgi:hypothetical protein
MSENAADRLVTTARQELAKSHRDVMLQPRPLPLHSGLPAADCVLGPVNDILHAEHTPPPSPLPSSPAQIGR